MDKNNPVRGLVNGMVIGTAIWITIIGIVYTVTL